MGTATQFYNMSVDEGAVPQFRRIVDEEMESLPPELRAKVDYRHIPGGPIFNFYIHTVYNIFEDPKDQIAMALERTIRRVESVPKLGRELRDRSANRPALRL